MRCCEHRLLPPVIRAPDWRSSEIELAMGIGSAGRLGDRVGRTSSLNPAAGFRRGEWPKAWHCPIPPVTCCAPQPKPAADQFAAGKQASASGPAALPGSRIRGRPRALTLVPLGSIPGPGPSAFHGQAVPPGIQVAERACAGPVGPRIASAAIGVHGWLRATRKWRAGP